MKSNQKLDANLREYANDIYHSVFSSRPSLQQAYEYAMQIAKSTGNGNQAAFLTAIHVILNTVSNELDNLIDESMSD